MLSRRQPRPTLDYAIYLNDCICCSTQEMAAIYPDRVITVRGTVENMSQAEAAISAILRECIDKNLSSSVSIFDDWSFLCVFGLNLLI